jgi:heat-inducible transcriptional repressor
VLFRSGAADERKSLIVRGQGNLLKDLTATEDLERIRQLFDDFEAKREIIQLLGASDQADGVRIFIGSENKMFSLSGSSLVVAPFRDETRRVVGVLGVIGPTRLNYARIIPMVDYTAKLVSRLMP